MFHQEQLTNVNTIKPTTLSI